MPLLEWWVNHKVCKVTQVLCHTSSKGAITTPRASMHAMMYAIMCAATQTIHSGHTVCTMVRTVALTVRTVQCSRAQQTAYAGQFQEATTCETTPLTGRQCKQSH